MVTINTKLALALFGLMQAIFVGYLGWRQSRDKNSTDIRTAKISEQASVIKAQTDTLVATLELAQARLNDAHSHIETQVAEIKALRDRVRSLEFELIELNRLRERIEELERENATLKDELENSKRREIQLRRRLDRLEKGDTGPLGSPT